MNKSKTFSLQPLVNLAHQMNDAATKRFGHLNQQQQAAQTKLDALLQYRKDYQARFHEAVRTGMSQSDLRNFQDFMQRLDEAIAQQRVATEQAMHSVEAGRNDLQDSQRKLKSFDTLEQRHVEKERKISARSEQRQQDEQSGRHAILKAAAQKDK